MHTPTPTSLIRRRLNRRSFCFLFVVLLSSALVQLSDAAFAQGSLQLVFHPKTGKSTEQHPLTANLTHLWCQAAMNLPNGVAEKVPIASAKFLHFGPQHPDKSFPARIADNRAFLDLGTKDLHVAGKYRCEMTTENDEFVYGNMFIYMRPVFHVNSSMRLDYIDDQGSKFEFVGSSVKATKGSTGVLHCPAIGYPTPEIRWFKDNQIILETDKHRFFRNQLHILDVDEKDEGVYRCIASNEFPPAVDFKEVQYEAILDQQLRVGNSLGWLVPLILIIVILILLFVTIYSCAWYKKHKGQKYDVASKEKERNHDAEKQRLREVADEE